MEIEYLQWFLRNFYCSQIADVRYKRESLGSNHTKINSVLFAGKFMISVALPHKDFYSKDFLEDKEKSLEVFDRPLEVTKNFHG